MNICQQCGKEFLILPLEQTFYQKKDLPTPTNCPACRKEELLSLRNENKLYKRTCDKCQKNILSTYPPESTYQVYCKECYWESLN